MNGTRIRRPPRGSPSYAARLCGAPTSAHERRRSRPRARGAVGDDADVDPGQLADHPREERAARGSRGAALVGRADEDVRRAALGGHAPHVVDEVVALLLEEVGAEDDGEPPQRGELRRLSSVGSRPGVRTQSASMSAPSRCAERQARRRMRCDFGCGSTSASMRSPTACRLSGSSTVGCAPRLDVLGDLAQRELAQRREVLDCGRSSASAASARSRG